MINGFFYNFSLKKLYLFNKIRFRLETGKIIPTWTFYHQGKSKRFLMQRVITTVTRLFLVCAAICSVAFATTEPALKQSSYLYDEDRLLSAQEANFLGIIVHEVMLKSDVKIATVLMDESHTSETYAFAKTVANKWRLEGDSTKGILIFVSMKEHSKHIIASEGFKANYPSIDFDRIQQETLIPSFRVGKYGRGIISFVWQISSDIIAADGKTLSADPKELFTEEAFPWYNYIFIVLVFGAVAVAFFYARPKKKTKAVDKMQGYFNGKFGTFKNFNGSFKN